MVIDGAGICEILVIGVDFNVSAEEHSVKGFKDHFFSRVVYLY
jgi:hypothetical protein